jgi:uncharacterized membrane protein YbhN (UPF0104 family)
VNKRTFGNLLKYGLAAGLMAYVVWSNWGDPRGTVGKITVGESEGKGKVSGRVVAYTPDDAIKIEEPSGQTVELALKRASFSVMFWKKPSLTEIVGADGEPWPEGKSLVGETVSASSISRGLAYVWRRHVIERVPIHWGYCALAFVIGFIAVLSTFVRWYILVRAVDLPFRMADAMRLGFIGLFFNTFLPGSVGGDAIKAWFLIKEQSRRTVAVATVIMDRAIALWALVWFVALLGAAFWLGGLLVGDGAEQCRRIVVVAWVIVGASMVVWCLLGLLPGRRADQFAERLERLPRFGGHAAELWRAVWIYRCRPATVYGVMALSLAGFVGFVLLFYYSMLTLWDTSSGQEVPTLTQHFLIIPIGLVIQAMPLFPGGAGIGELGFGLLYDWVGASEAAGVQGSVVQRIIMWVYGLIGYVIYKRMHLALPPDKGQGTGDGEQTEEPSVPRSLSPVP